jgi:acetoin utilization protein AcuC
MHRTAFLYTDALLSYKLSSSHPLKQHRLQQVKRLLDAYGAFDTIDLLEPVSATEVELLSVHTAEYLLALQKAGHGEAVVDIHQYGLVGDTPVFPNMYEASALYAGGTIEAARLVLSGKYDAAFNVSGGLHHAFPHKAHGFCTLNDLALGIETLKAGGKKRVVYVDIDVHHGDGVEFIYRNDPDVLTISLHESGRYLFPGTGRAEDCGGAQNSEARGSAVNVPFHPHTDDALWHLGFDTVVPAVIERFGPDAFVLQFGADAHWGDPLAHIQMSSQGWMEMVGKLFAITKNTPTVITGGGGYNVATVTRLWTMLAMTRAGLEIPELVPEPLAGEFGITHLHDTDVPRLDIDEFTEGRLFLEDQLAILRSVHGL